MLGFANLGNSMQVFALVGWPKNKKKEVLIGKVLIGKIRFRYENVKLNIIMIIQTKTVLYDACHKNN